jgi:DNA-binding IclR family transcriptional regulator
MNEEQKALKTIQSVERALDILESFDHFKQEFGVTELSKHLRLHKSTVHGIMTTLTHRGYLDQNLKTGGYRLGLKLFELGEIVQEGIDLKTISEPFLEQLLEKFGETVHLVIMDHWEVVYIDKRESRQSMRIVSQVGKRLPAHCSGVGKSMLAWQAPEELDEFLRLKGLPRLTAKTITDEHQFREELARIRQQGYAVDNEEITEGLRCVAAPIFNHSGEVAGAMSIAGPTVRMTEDRIQQIIDNVVRTAGAISTKMGHKSPQHL